MSAITRDHQITRSSSYPHPAFFHLLLKTKAEPSIDPWVALASRLGDPWVTQASPKPNPKPNPNRQKGRGLFSFTQLTNYSFTKFYSGTVKAWQSAYSLVFKEPLITTSP